MWLLMDLFWRDAPTFAVQALTLLGCLTLSSLPAVLLLCRHVGLLIVHVMEGRDLKKMDMIGKADPFLEMYTQPTAVEKTVRGILTALNAMARCFRDSPRASAHPSPSICTCVGCSVFSYRDSGLGPEGKLSPSMHWEACTRWTEPLTCL